MLTLYTKAITVFLATQAAARTIHNSCLSLSDQTVGNDLGYFMTNEGDLINQPE